MDSYKFKVTQLREHLQKRGLSTYGCKADLIERLQEADPEGHWRQELEESTALAGGESAGGENILAPPIPLQEEARGNVPALPVTSQGEKRTRVVKKRTGDIGKRAAFGRKRKPNTTQQWKWQGN